MDNTNTSFIMIKPDSINDSSLRDELLRQVNRYQLSILETFNTNLRKEDIKYFWPHKHYLCPITSYLLQYYLAEENLVVFLLHGQDAISKTNTIKYNIREKYSKGTFSNCVHSPYDLIEFKSQLFCLLKNIGRGSQLEGHELLECIDLDTKGIWGRLSQVNEEKLGTIIWNIWEKSKAVGWEKLWDYTFDHSNSYLILINNQKTKNFFDYISSCLYEIFTEWEPERAIISAIEFDRKGYVLLSSGEKKDMSRILKKLQDFGLTGKTISSSVSNFCLKGPSR